MQFHVTTNVYTRKGKRSVWLEPGDYGIIRLFGDNRVLVDVSTLNTPKRQITLLDMSQGTISYDTKENPTQTLSD